MRALETRAQLAAAAARHWIDDHAHLNGEVTDLRALAQAVAALPHAEPRHRATAQAAVRRAVTTARRGGRSWGDIAAVIDVGPNAARRHLSALTRVS